MSYSARYYKVENKPYLKLYKLLALILMLLLKFQYCYYLKETNLVILLLISLLQKLLIINLRVEKLYISTIKKIR